MQALDGLCEKCLVTVTLFDRAGWYQMLADTGVVPLIAIASDNKSSAVLALTEEPGRIAPLRNWYSFSWRPWAPPGAQGDALLTALARQIKSRTHRVTLDPVPDEDGSAARLAAAFRAAGWQVEMLPCDINHVITIDGRTFAEYWAGRPGTLRTTVKRKGKMVETRIVTHFDPALWDAYERIYAASWKPTEGNPAMLRALAEQEGLAGRLRLGLAYHHGEPVAAQFWTVDNSIAYIHKLAHLESHRHLSAGTILSAALFEHVIDQDKVHIIDFGTGDQAYKAHWMEQARLRFRIDCLDGRQVRAWPALVKRFARRIIRPTMPVLARTGMHG